MTGEDNNSGGGFNPTIDTGGGNIENLAQTIDQDKSTGKQVNNVDNMESGAEISQTNINPGEDTLEILEALRQWGLEDEAAAEVKASVDAVEEGDDESSLSVQGVMGIVEKYGPRVAGFAGKLAKFLPQPAGGIIEVIADAAQAD